MIPHVGFPVGQRRTVPAGDRRPRRRRSLAGGTRPSADLASVVAGGALLVHPRGRGRFYPLRPVGRRFVVPPRLCARPRRGDRLCGFGLSHHPCPADGAPVWLSGHVLLPTLLRTRGRVGTG